MIWHHAKLASHHGKASHPVPHRANYAGYHFYHNCGAVSCSAASSDVRFLACVLRYFRAEFMLIGQVMGLCAWIRYEIVLWCQILLIFVCFFVRTNRDVWNRAAFEQANRFLLIGFPIHTNKQVHFNRLWLKITVQYDLNNCIHAHTQNIRCINF